MSLILIFKPHPITNSTSGVDDMSEYRCPHCAGSAKRIVGLRSMVKCEGETMCQFMGPASEFERPEAAKSMKETTKIALKNHALNDKPEDAGLMPGKVPHLECLEQCIGFKRDCYQCGVKDATPSPSHLREIAELKELMKEVKEHLWRVETKTPYADYIKLIKRDSGILIKQIESLLNTDK